MRKGGEGFEDLSIMWIPDYGKRSVYWYANVIVEPDVHGRRRSTGAGRYEGFSTRVAVAMLLPAGSLPNQSLIA